MRRFCILFSLTVCGLIAGIARGETYKLANGQELVGEMLVTSANDLGVQIKVGEGNYQKVSWSDFSQDEIKRFARNPKLQPFVEPFIEISSEERIKKTEPNLKPPLRLQQPPRQSLPGALFSSGLGFFILFVLFAANVYAGYEVAIFRARPVLLVCGVAAVLPIAGPIIFLSLPTQLRPGEEPVAVPAEGAAVAAAGGAVAGAVAAPAADDAVNPMQADGAAHPTGLRLAHVETDKGPSLPPTTTYQRGQYTFNRRFIETKFPGFFGVVRRDADKDMVLVIKCARGEYTGQRISRIASNDLHLQVQRGPASEEVLIPFQEIQQVQVKHKDAK